MYSYWCLCLLLFMDGVPPCMAYKQHYWLYDTRVYVYWYLWVIISWQKNATNSFGSGRINANGVLPRKICLLGNRHVRNLTLFVLSMVFTCTNPFADVWGCSDSRSENGLLEYVMVKSILEYVCIYIYICAIHYIFLRCKGLWWCHMYFV